MMTLGELCDLVAGRATLVVEFKHQSGGDRRLVTRAANVLSKYRGPVAVMSFDWRQIAQVRDVAPRLPHGMVAQSRHPGRGTVDAARARPDVLRRSVAGAAAVHRLFGERPARGDAHCWRAKSCTCRC